MKRLHLTLWLVLALLMVVASGHCDLKWGITARSAGMGNADIAVTDDNEAWSQNPAGLAKLSVKPRGSSSYGWVAGITPTFGGEVGGGDWDGFYLALGVCDPDQGMGFGGGWNRDSYGAWDGTWYGAGFGMCWRSHPQLSWGVAVAHSVSETTGVVLANGAPNREAATTFDVGLLYTIPQPDDGVLKIGAKFTDLGDEAKAMWGGRQCGFGVAYYAPRNWLVAADWDGIGSDFDSEFRAGVEYRADNGLAARVGCLDGQFTYGAGYRWGQWGVDFARTSRDGDAVNLATLWGEF